MSGLRTISIAAMTMLVVAGCTGRPDSRGNAGPPVPGLTSGPLPEPQPFVIESRRSAEGAYPNVVETPPRRAQRPMSTGEVRALDDSLRRAGRVPRRPENGEPGRT